ncbi:MAG: FkbM family methyltransferase [Patescibacteria group bacterium]|nr:FkbM family methyltransferase [Patescibacteria group bacterium]
MERTGGQASIGIAEVITWPIQFNAYGHDVNFKLELDPDDPYDAFMIYHFQNNLMFEVELVWVMLRTLLKGDIAIDIGANHGLFTIIMSQLVGSLGLVVACEPASTNLPLLGRHLEINKVDNVQIVKNPIWCQNEEVTFWLNSDCRGSNALFDPGNWFNNQKSRDNPQPIKMQAITLDSFDVAKEKIKLIKIDTEGAEQKILEGAKDLLEKYHPPYILSELNPHGMAQAGNDDDSLREFMRGYGYEMFFLHSADVLPAYVPSQVKSIHKDGVVVSNVMFASMADMAKAWPEMLG